MTHKSEDCKISAVKYYLKNKDNKKYYIKYIIWKIYMEYPICLGKQKMPI